MVGPHLCSARTSAGAFFARPLLCAVPYMAVAVREEDPPPPPPPPPAVGSVDDRPSPPPLGDDQLACDWGLDIRLTPALTTDCPWDRRSAADKLSAVKFPPSFRHTASRTWSSSRPLVASTRVGAEMRIASRRARRNLDVGFAAVSRSFRV